MEFTASTENFCVPGTRDKCGNGVCNAQGNLCICDAGYIHDYIQMLFPTCYMTEPLRMGLIIAFIVMCVAIGALAVYMIPGRRGIPKFMCQLVVLNSVIETCHLIALAAEGRPGIATIVFLMFLNVTGGCLCPLTFLYALTSPAMDLMMLHQKQRMIERTMGVITLVVLCEQVSVLTTALVFQYRGDTRMFNILYSVQYLWVALFAIGIVYCVKAYSTILFKAMDQIIGSMSSDAEDKEGGALRKGEETSQARTRRKIIVHRKKLGMAVVATQILALVSLFSCVLFAAIYFALGVHLYRVVIFIVYSTLFPSFNLIILYFCHRKEDASSSNDALSGAHSGDSKAVVAPELSLVPGGSTHHSVNQMFTGGSNAENSSAHEPVA